MQQLLDMGAVSKLPEDVQWGVRMLLPRREEPAVAAAKAAQAAVTGLGHLTAPGGLLNNLQQPAQLPLLPQLVGSLSPRTVPISASG
jgi:hypothetical protein